MPMDIRPPTKSQLRQAFEPYRQAFPDWSVEHDVVLYRSVCPVKQKIALHALRSGAYRPSHSIELILPIPDGCSLLGAYLDVRHREVLLREHDVKWPKVLKAMEEQFLPAVRKPLSVSEVLLQSEREMDRNGSENINDLTGLAAINAFAGLSQRALYWCGRVVHRAAHMGRPLGDWEVRKVEFVLALQAAVEAGTVSNLLKT